MVSYLAIDSHHYLNFFFFFSLLHLYTNSFAPPGLINRPAVALQEKLSEQLEGQRQEQALQRYHSEAEELDHWLLSTRATLSSALRPVTEDLDMEEQLIDCQVKDFATLSWFFCFFL